MDKQKLIDDAIARVTEYGTVGAMRWLAEALLDQRTATAVQMPEPDVFYEVGARATGNAYSQEQMQAYGDARAEEARREERKKFAPVQGMADCMDMVRQELIEAGAIDASCAPMFIADAVVRKLSQRTAGGDPAAAKDDSDRSYDRPIGYLSAADLSRLNSGHDANLRSAKFGPSALDGDVPIYLDAQPVAEAAAQADGEPPRYFMDHGVLHDRVSGQHMWTQEQYDENMRTWYAAGYEDMAAGLPPTFKVGMVAAAPTAQPTPPDDERAAFEKFAARSKYVLDCDSDGDYENGYTESAWDGWMARAALRQPGAVGDGEAICENMIAFFTEKGRPELSSAVQQVLSQIQHKQSLQPVAEAAAQADDVAVDRFAAVMKEKMDAGRAKGRGGWDDPAQCQVQDLARMLVEHVEKGDPVDIGNFAMMLWNRKAMAIDIIGEFIIATTPAERAVIGAAPTAQPTLPDDERYQEILRPILSRKGMRCYMNGDAITLDPSDYRAIIDRAALRQPGAVGDEKGGTA